MSLLLPGAWSQEVKVRKESFELLKKMCELPSPTGFEQPVQRVWRKYMDDFCESVYSDTQGNAIAVVNKKGTPRVMFAAHSDEIGFIVNYVNNDGFLGFHRLGLFDEPIIPGRRVIIHTAKGPVVGVIGKTPIHLIRDRGKGASIEDLWIDIGTKDKEQAESLVALGDAVTYDSGFMHLRGDLYVARAFDDRAGLFIVAELLRHLSESQSLEASVYGVSTVQEEIGMRGAITSTFAVKSLVGIAIDMTYASDQPGINQKRVGLVKLGGGPVIARGPHLNPQVYNLLVDTAKKKSIPYQFEICRSSTGTDASVIQVSRAGVASGLVSVPVRYMHTPVEMIHMADVLNTIKLLVAFTEAIKKDMAFKPQ